MKQGERQVSPSLDGIRRDHTARYEWAAKVIPVGSRVLDYACGIGYGTKILADAGHWAHGFDIDAEAVAYAAEHYAHPQACVRVGNGNVPGVLLHADTALCFETIEHIEDPRPLLKALREASPMLLASVPNESVIPWQKENGDTVAFHHRHYTKQEFNALLEECGWCAVEWFGQLGPESEVEPNIHGRTLIAVCQREAIVEREPDVQERHIAILGLGPSVDQYLDIVKRQGGRSKFCDETWSINALGDVFACDLVFHMDDVRIQEIRAAAAPASNIAAMLKWIKTSKVPVVTSRAHPDYPALVEFPLEDVLNHFGHEYFNSTAAYAIAFAIHTGATQISLFGMDFSYANTHDAEKGRACVEFWCGMAHAKGIKVHLPKSTALMDACHTRAERLYGYDTLDVGFAVQADGMLKLDFVPRETLPTAAEIERNYDHSAPVREQHLRINTP